jgi:hypothetical protein
MAKRKSTIGRLDTLARKIVRLRDVTCQCPECEDGMTLQCCHISFIRRYYVSRWDLINLLLMCTTCHTKFDTNHAWGMGWFAEQFPARAKYLSELDVKSPKERTKVWRDCDLKEIELQLKEKLLEML